MRAFSFPFHREIQRIFYFGATAVLLGGSLGACKIANSKRPVNPDNSGGNAVFSFIKSEQVALNSLEISAMLSGMSAQVLVASKDSTFAAWVNPTSECKALATDGVDVQATGRRLDVGHLQLGGFSSQEDIPFDVKNTVYQQSGVHLPAGSYTIKADGIRGSFALSQEFLVLAPASNIRLTSGSGASQPLPTPEFPAETDPDYLAVINKGEDLKIEYNAPPETSYVRTMIFDGSNNEMVPIVCYSPPFTPTTVPAERFRLFRQTDDAYMYVDFVNISFKTDATGIKESFIQSYTRHIHGMQIFSGSNGTERVNFGKLRIQ